MWQDLEVELEKVAGDHLKEKPDQNNLGFGTFFTDHMFRMEWSREQGWHDARICPLQEFTVHPAAMVFHYGQAIFEGLKAYRGKDEQIFLFRPKDNLERMNSSAVRMCMPRIPVDKVFKSLKALLYLERDWIPSAPGASLYIRPTMIAVEPVLGVRPSAEYLFYIIMCPVGSYYGDGFSPTRIFVSDTYARAVRGGVGEAKAAGNYAASLLACEEAKKAGYTQVLWLDACEHKYIEEVGTSNIFFYINDELITPPLQGSILHGLTRDSVVTMAKEWGIKVVERRLSIHEVVAASRDGSLREVFATGTAAVISPVGEMLYKEEQIIVNGGEAGELARKFFDELQKIQFGEKKDNNNWSIRVC
ncbi:MAG: branched-chain amino acid aminotransferase [Desulfopila sp.]|nr:branched-chain amino acid aminotransferase [Desulfopila sp.]